jgi:hypothetical protein
MYKQDILQKIIEYFFSTIRKLIKVDIEVLQINFEQQCNNLLLDTFDVSIQNISMIDKEKYASIIYNEENKHEMVLLLLKIATLYSSTNSKLAIEYLDLSKEVWNKPSKIYSFKKENSKKQIDELFQDLETKLNSNT